MSQRVDAILQQIGRLDEVDRFLLEQRLQDLAEAEWQQQAETARELAHQRGIDQKSIDEAIEDVRYGS